MTSLDFRLFAPIYARASVDEALSLMRGTVSNIGRIPEALENGCGYDAPGSFAAWLSRQTPMHAWRMPGARHDIGDMKSYEAVRDSYRGPGEGKWEKKRWPELFRSFF